MRELFRENQKFSINNGRTVKVKEIMELINENQFEKELIDLFNLKVKVEETIEIEGSKEIVDLVLNYDKKFTKKDLILGVNDIEITNIFDSGMFELEIKDVDEKLRVKLLRDAQSEYFNIFNATNYFDFLHNHDKDHIIKENWELIKENFGKENLNNKKFRVISDDKTNYVRAIVSTNRYYNYDIKFAVFLSLLVLHEQCKKEKTKFRVDSIDLTDSRINLRFIRCDILESKETNSNFIVEVSNDEIKKKALHFTGIRRVNIVSEDFTGDFTVESQNSKYNFINVSHNILPDKVLSSVSGIDNMSKIERDLEVEWNQLLSIEKPDQLRFLLFDKIEKAKNEKVKIYKSEIKKMNIKINHIYDLLKLMGKIDMLIEESDIDAKLYLHYLFDEILFNR